MKRLSGGMLLVLALLFTSACTAPRHMIVTEGARPDIRSIKPAAGKSALVVARTTVFGGAIEFDTYLDQKMIGVTQRKGFFITEVTPGSHYVISKAENMEPAKISFEPERVYYLQQVPRMGIWRARVSNAVLTPEELLSTLDDGCKLMVYDPKDPGEDLSDKDFKEAVADYERELKEGLHQDVTAYRGVPAK